MIPDPVMNEPIRYFKMNPVFFNADQSDCLDPGGKMLGAQGLFDVRKGFLPKSVHRRDFPIRERGEEDKAVYAVKISTGSSTTVDILLRPLFQASFAHKTRVLRTNKTSRCGVCLQEIFTFPLGGARLKEAQLMI
jgi:hypothetical protein